MEIDTRDREIDTIKDRQSSGGKVLAGTIAGATIGGVAVVVLIAAGIFWLLRRRRQQNNNQMPLPAKDFKEPGDQSLPPYRQVISRAGVPIMELNSTQCRKWTAVSLCTIEHEASQNFQHRKVALLSLRPGSYT